MLSAASAGVILALLQTEDRATQGCDLSAGGSG